MKRILLPTDFSRHSEKALEFAINIAKVSNAKIIVSHCFFVPNPSMNTAADVMEELYMENKKDTDKVLMECCQKISLHKNRKGVSIPTKYISEQDLPYSHMHKVIYKESIDLVVMGIENKTYLFDFLGSIALHVPDTAKCPVLLIHEKSRYKYFNRVYFVIEDVKEDLQKIKKIIPFTMLYDSEISVLHVARRPKDEDPLEVLLYQKSQYDALLNQIIHEYSHYPNVRFHYNVSDETFEKMDHMLKNVEPDLLVLIHKDKNLSDSVFYKSSINHILRTTDTPLMVIY